MTKYPQSIIAGVSQFDVKTGDIDTNLDAVTNAIFRLAEKGAHLAVLPELWSSGFGDSAMISELAEKTPQIIENLSTLAKKHQIIIAGSLPEKSGDTIYNTMMVIDKNGTIAGQYRKVHLFSFIAEDKTFSPGNRAVICETTCGPIGLMICYDLRFPELCRYLAISGARLVIVSAQWPKSRIAHWNTLLQARAIENQIFMAASNRVGKEGDLAFNGHSQIISPDGRVLACVVDQTAETTSQIDFSEIDIMRKRFNCLKERVPAAYSYDIKK